MIAYSPIDANSTGATANSTGATSCGCSWGDCDTCTYACTFGPWAAFSSTTVDAGEVLVDNPKPKSQGFWEPGFEERIHVHQARQVPVPRNEIFVINRRVMFSKSGYLPWRKRKRLKDK